MKRTFLVLLLVLFCACLCAGQAVPVTASILDGAGNPLSGSSLKFQLYNAGANICVIAGGGTLTGTTVSFPANSSGVVCGNIVANDQISCGGIWGTTRWYVTPMTNTPVPLRISQRYNIQHSNGRFNFGLAMVDTSTPPATAWTTLFGNPVKSQTWTQPPGTTGYFVGSYDFSNASVAGISGGGGGGGATLQTDNTTNGSQTLLNLIAGNGVHLSNVGGST